MIDYKNHIGVNDIITKRGGKWISRLRFLEGQKHFVIVVILFKTNTAIELKIITTAKAATFLSSNITNNLFFIL